MRAAEGRGQWALAVAQKRDSFRRGWYKFSRDRMSVVGLVSVFLVVLVAVLAPYITPYPAHAKAYVNFTEARQPPSLSHFFGTDVLGRDVFSRVLFGFQFSLLLGVVVLGITVPIGVTFGLIAGYNRGRWLETAIMRVTDIFLAVPPLILALAVSSILKPNIFNAMMAVSMTWWPWYCRLVFAASSSIRTEAFVQAAEVTGASGFRIATREILPNCISTIFTKMTLDMGLVIIMGSCLSFLGLGVQPPKPGLGTMIADGANYLPAQWWICVFPALGIVVIVLGFNLLGDGLRDLFAVEEV